MRLKPAPICRQSGYSLTIIVSIFYKTKSLNYFSTIKDVVSLVPDIIMVKLP